MSGFSRDQGGVAELGGTPIAKLLDQAAVSTPAYLYDLDGIAEATRGLIAGFGSAAHVVAYAVKANTAGSVVRTVAAAGGGADVVSGAELQVALASGISPERVVMSGVAKQDHELDLAITRGILGIQLDREGGPVYTPGSKAPNRYLLAKMHVACADNQVHRNTHRSRDPQPRPVPRLRRAHGVSPSPPSPLGSRRNRRSVTPSACIESISANSDPAGARSSAAMNRRASGICSSNPGSSSRSASSEVGLASINRLESASSVIVIAGPGATGGAPVAGGSSTVVVSSRTITTIAKMKNVSSRNTTSSSGIISNRGSGMSWRTRCIFDPGRFSP